MKLLDFIFPKRCVGCRKIGQYICATCESKVVHLNARSFICPVCQKRAIDGATHPRCQTRYGIDGLTSFFRYRGIMKRAIKAVKYRYTHDLVPAIADLIPDQSVTMLMSIKPSCIVPIPLHRSREKTRGFNQAQRFATHIASVVPVPIYSSYLRRRVHKIAQADIASKTARMRNMKGVFAARGNLEDKRILLVDDVYTTGATLRSAARELKRAGAKRVWGVTMAR